MNGEKGMNGKKGYNWEKKGKNNMQTYITLRTSRLYRFLYFSTASLAFCIVILVTSENFLIRSLLRRVLHHVQRENWRERLLDTFPVHFGAYDLWKE